MTFCVTVSRGKFAALSFIFCAGAVAVGSAAVAQQSPDWETCTGRNYPTFEQRNSACTAIIDSESATPADRAKALGFRGVAYANNRNTDAAVRDYEESLRLDGDSASGHHFRGNKFLIEKNSAGALAEFNEAVQLDPADVFTLNNRGRIYLEQKDYDHAIADFDAAIRLDAGWALPYYGRGSAYYATKDYDRAILDFGATIRLNPKFVYAYTARGAAYRTRGDYADAIADYDQAIQLDPNASIAFYNRGTTYFLRRDYDHAAADYDETIRLNPKFAPAFLARGQVHSQKEEHLPAIADYDTAIQLDPKLAVAYGNRCADRIAAGQDLHAALSDCDASLRLQPGQTAPQSSRGFIYLKLGNAADAAAAFDSALAIDAKHVWSLYGRGLAKWQKGDVPGALADITAATKIRPDIMRAAAKFYGLPPERNLLARFASTETEAHPMVFAVAHGSPDACGPGCSEWIVADGAFDQAIDKRFRNFLDGLKGRSLPIFFNSSGGAMTRSLIVGRILRERKMTAEIGITIADDCQTINDQCRQMLQTGDPVKAHLRPAGAVCNSACVYAFMGATVRIIPDGAHLGVHSPIRPEPDTQQARRAMAAVEDREHAERRQYAKQMGVDPDVVDLADGTPFIEMHVLTHDEIARFQIETPQH
jgi:tetratricopeptide (TPR) repeat protein